MGMLGMQVAGMVAALGVFGASGLTDWAAMTPEEKSASDASYVLDFRMETIEGGERHLADFEGKVLMIVNTASLCGLTPQYEGLQELYDTYNGQGLEVLAFPCNQFGRQEPGSAADILAFCSERYDVSFPIFGKVDVKGDDAAPLYQRLNSQPKPVGGEPEWNFTKFVVDRSGRVVARFSPRVKPSDPELVAKVEELLGSES